MPVPKSEQNLCDDVSMIALTRAIGAGNLPDTLRLIEAAGQQRSARSVSYLAAILRQKDRWRERMARNRPARRCVKLTAVEALQKIGSPGAAEALGVALFDQDVIVRQQSARALVSFGKEAVPRLLRLLENRREWTVPQMRLLLGVLNEIGDPRSGPALARVLLGIQPNDSTRWFRQTFLAPGSFTVLAMWAISFLSLMRVVLTGDIAFSIEVLFGCLAGGLVIGVLCGLMLFLPIFFMFLSPLGNMWANNERAALAQSAAEALIRLKDKRSLPSVIEAAYKGRRKAQNSARRVLCRLLPLLSEGDAELLPSSSLQLLLDSISPMRQALAPQSPDLMVAIVQSLRHVGPGSAFDAVQKLEQRSDAPPVRDACREVLPVLQARREQERASGSLLRASAQPATPENELLRPASAASETDPNELLRPAE